jgi:diguanylate cyclase
VPADNDNTIPLRGQPAVAISQNPNDIARETLRLLASRKIPPTPENYQRIYDEIADARPDRPVDAVERISQLLREIAAAYPGVPALAVMARGVGERDWTQFGAALAGLAAQRNDAARQDWASIVRDLLRQIEMRQTGTSLARKKEGLERLLINFGSDPQFADKLQGLLRSWAEAPEASSAAIEMRSDAPPRAEAGTGVGGNQLSAISAQADNVKQLKELLGQALEQGVAARLERFPDLAEEAKALAQQARDARGADAWIRFTAQLKQLWYRLELRGESDAELLSSLTRLLRLLVNNIGELAEDDTWVSGQLAVIRAVIDQPLSVERIEQAERSFKQVVYKQSLLKHSLREVKSTLKNLITMFVERLSEMTTSTAGYHDRIGGYADRLSRTDDLPALKTIVDDLMSDTRSMQVDILRRRDDMLEARKQAGQAEERVRQLEAELEHVSEQVREDQLTGTLNRRGLDDAMQREVARAQRRKTPLCVAVLDLDNFKKLNDTYGHQAGDDALVHLANVVKKTLRPTDIVARFGGEEFLILFSDTGIKPAVEIMRRLQRDLTKQFFLHDHERLLITFSAGVAVLKPEESQDSVFARADKAMYQAKLQGKNRVVAAED